MTNITILATVWVNLVTNPVPIGVTPEGQSFYAISRISTVNQYLADGSWLNCSTMNHYDFVTNGATVAGRAVSTAPSPITVPLTLWANLVTNPAPVGVTTNGQQIYAVSTTTTIDQYLADGGYLHCSTMSHHSFLTNSPSPLVPTRSIIIRRSGVSSVPPLFQRGSLTNGGPDPTNFALMFKTSFPTQTGHIYGLEATDNFAGWTLRPPEIDGTGQDEYFLDALDPATFYRITSRPGTLPTGQMAIVDTERWPYTLTPWASAAIRWDDFPPDDCSVMEGCAQPGPRKLLIFSVTIYNPSTQPDGMWSPTNATYEYDPCHHHFHMVDFSEFLLLSGNQVVVASRKMGWCVRNWYRLIDLYQTNVVDGVTNIVMWNFEPTPAGCVPPKFDPGWSDTYSGNVGAQPCMWFDVTGLPDGDYTMWIETDPLQKLDAHYIATHPIRMEGDSVIVLEN